VRGLRHDHASALRQSVHDNGEFLNVEEIWNRSSGISHASLKTLANADTFQSLHMERRDTVWELQALTSKPAPLDAFFEARSRPSLSHLPQASLQQEMFQDYRTTGLSLKAHPLDFLRPTLSQRGARSAHDLGANFGIRVGTKVSAAGLVITRQRPGTAKGVVFLTLEDETGSLNVVIRPNLFDSNRASIMNSSVLLATGKLERVGEVIYIDAERVSSLDRELMAMVRRRDGAFS
jgi:error-prone DNA polymerase